MAMILCPCCGEQISEHAKKCIHCGYVLLEEPKRTCPECGAEIEENASVCAKCGYPIEPIEEEHEPQKVEIAKVSMRVDKKKVTKYVAITVAVVAVIVAIVLGVSASKKAKAQEALESYSESFDSCIYSMYIGAIQAERAGGLIHDVWYNTIYEERDSNTDKFTRSSGHWNSDFNTSLSALFSDSSFKSDISSIKSSQDTVAALMKELNNPPDEYADAYEALRDLYEAYCDLTECAVNPSGNLQTYTSTFNAADSDFVKYYKAVNLYR